jgi:hypothetical protein
MFGITMDMSECNFCVSKAIECNFCEITVDHRDTKHRLKLASEHQSGSASEQEFSLSSQEHQKILNRLFLSIQLLVQYPANSFRLFRKSFDSKNVKNENND